MMRSHHLVFALALAASAGAIGSTRLPAGAAAPAPAATAAPATPAPFGQLKWREVGPALAGGRTTAVVGSARNPFLYYLGTAAGGVWKSANGGATWSRSSTSRPSRRSARVAIDPNNDEVVWVGTGESEPAQRRDLRRRRLQVCRRRRDLDATWASTTRAADLAHRRRPARFQRTSSSAALGDFFADSHAIAASTSPRRRQNVDARRSTSGRRSGASAISRWTRTIPACSTRGFGSSGACRGRFQSGGPDDGLYKSTDGGATWTKLDGQRLARGADRAHRPRDRAEQSAIASMRSSSRPRACSVAFRRRRRHLDDRLQGYARRPAPVLLLPPQRSTRRTQITCTPSPRCSRESKDGGKTFKDRRRRPRRLPRHLDRAERSQADHRGRRRRLRADRSTAASTGLLGEPRDRPGLSRRLSTTHAVLGLRARCRTTTRAAAPRTRSTAAASRTTHGSASTGGDGEWARSRPGATPNSFGPTRRTATLSVFDRMTLRPTGRAALRRPRDRRLRSLARQAIASTGIRRSRSRRGIRHDAGSAATSSSRRADRGRTGRRSAPT